MDKVDHELPMFRAIADYVARLAVTRLAQVRRVHGRQANGRAGAALDRVAPLLCSAILLPFAPALAQSDAASASARAGAEQVRVGDAITPEHAAGDWGGVRTKLVDRGIDVQFGYLTEVAGIASGGLRKGVDYAHQIKLQADLDGGPLIGADGIGFHVAIINREGRSASADYLGDDIFQVQEIYGGTGNADLHLSFLYAEYGGHGIDVKAGRMAVGQDFATSPLYCQFLSLGLCPQPRALSLNATFSVVPSATWAARVRGQSGALYLAAGAYQARPRFGGPSGFDFGFSHTTGLVVPIEAGWEPRFGQAELQGHYKAGLVVDSSNYPDLLPGEPRHGRRLSWYLLADQMLVRTGKTGTDGVMLLVDWSHSAADTSVLRDFAFAGVAARGLFHKRPGDVINILFGHAGISGKLTAIQRASEDAGQPLPTGFPPAPGSFAGPAMAPGVQTSHDFVEVNYGFKLTTGVTLLPDVQYLWRPAAARAVPDALVLAGRLEINF